MTMITGQKFKQMVFSTSAITVLVTSLVASVALNFSGVAKAQDVVGNTSLMKLENALYLAVEQDSRFSSLTKTTKLRISDYNTGEQKLAMISNDGLTKIQKKDQLNLFITSVSSAIESKKDLISSVEGLERLIGDLSLTLGAGRADLINATTYNLKIKSANKKREGSIVVTTSKESPFVSFSLYEYDNQDSQDAQDRFVGDLVVDSEYEALGVQDGSKKFLLKNRSNQPLAEINLITNQKTLKTNYGINKYSNSMQDNELLSSTQQVRMSHLLLITGVMDMISGQTFTKKVALKKVIQSLGYDTKQTLLFIVFSPIVIPYLIFFY